MDPKNLSRAYDIGPQYVPCTGSTRTCYITSANLYQCRDGLQTTTGSTAFSQSNLYYELFPGAPATCGHGNREFSFFVRRGSRLDALIVVFLAGGICFDADGCGTDPNLRTLGVDLPATEKYASVDIYLKQALKAGAVMQQGILDPFSTLNPFLTWSVVLIPDCTGDLHVGNASRTYAQSDATKCITVHHRGATNAGTAAKWIAANFPRATSVLVVGTGSSRSSKAVGSHGAAFWAPYLQSVIPGATVRVLIDSSLGLFGPKWYTAMKSDPWGSAQSVDPNGATLLPPAAKSWFIGNDDLSTYYEAAASAHPTLAFADAGIVDHPLQQNLFVQTGGSLADCCLDGCSCDFGKSSPASSVLPFMVRQGAPYPTPGSGRGGTLDWTKTLKVTLLRRIRRLPNNYRVWLLKGATSPANYLLGDAELFGSQTVAGGTTAMCPKSDPVSVCITLSQFVTTFIGLYTTAGKILFNPDGSLAGSTLSGIDSTAYLNTYQQKISGPSICWDCLTGIPGTATDGVDGNDFCNATLGDGESLKSAAASIGADWASLFSLNGGGKVAGTGQMFRYAHEYKMRLGETIDDVATRLGTTVDAIMKLNYNTITHIQNAKWLSSGDIICVLPNWSNVKNQMGELVCPPTAGQ